MESMESMDGDGGDEYDISFKENCCKDNIIFSAPTVSETDFCFPGFFLK